MPYNKYIRINQQKYGNTNKKYRNKNGKGRESFYRHGGSGKIRQREQQRGSIQKRKGVPRMTCAICHREEEEDFLTSREDGSQECIFHQETL